MLVDLTSIVCGGVIDNTVRGTTDLTLRIAREKGEVRLSIPGDCLGDIAGCRVVFERTGSPPHAVSPQIQLYRYLRKLSSSKIPLIAGDMTFSRRQPSPLDTSYLSNMLSLEFFEGTETRVLVEGEDFVCSELSLPQWECTRAIENAQELINMSALHDHVLANVENFRGPGLSMLGKDMPGCKWDTVLNRAEAYMAILPSICHKYMAHRRGVIAEAFVFDQIDFLDSLAMDDEQGYDLTLTHTWTGWQVTDFLSRNDARRLQRAMRTSLFKAVAQLISVIREHITSHYERYRSNNAVEQILSVFAGLISHLLATIMLVHEHDTCNGPMILRRAETIALRLRELTEHARECLPRQASGQFSEAAQSILHELQNIVH